MAEFWLLGREKKDRHLVGWWHPLTCTTSVHIGDGFRAGSHWYSSESELGASVEFEGTRDVKCVGRSVCVLDRAYGVYTSNGDRQ